MSQNTYVGSINQGTAGTRFSVFDHGGNVVSSASRTHEQLYPNQGWVEHDPMEIWDNTKRVITDALERGPLEANQLEAIGVANQRETIVLWDASTGKPVTNAIVWQDRRTTDRIERLEAEDKVDAVRYKTGLEPNAYFSAPKAEWLLDNTDPITLSRLRSRDVRDRAADGELLLGTIDSWLVYNLTGNHVTDVTNASRTMLFNTFDLEWDDDLLAEFNVPAAALPEVRPSADEALYGRTDPAGFLGAEIPVAAALGDQQAALFGQTCFEPGETKTTYGTGSFMLMNTGERAVMSEHGLLTTVGFQLSGDPAQYALEGPIFTTGAAIEWLEQLSLIEDPAESEQLARRVESTDGVYFVPALTGLGAPHWDQRARGTIVGLTRDTRREHLVRAALESIAFQTRDVAEAMVEDASISLSTLRVDGGAVRNTFLCQLQATILQNEIIRPVVDETTALGAAYAAGLAVDYWASLDELEENWQVDRTFVPTEGTNVEQRYKRWQEAILRSADWA
ncbi:glycerol kinase GlpK [Natronococcus sp. A-GB7]|uniref:glycerol kinase GlpK n=1 Tax=Natronococcus sp. A-GB7 TaxID=3037649 RepID=UPI00241E7BBB|nr:glycerol kinase GlpK [Natronococcus sp. A-GB7]MDG5818397.1 glycerol kinase GlpK [Natronococcus sp. A-GB7]